MSTEPSVIILVPTLIFGFIGGFVGILIRTGSARSFAADMTPVIYAMISAPTLGRHVGFYSDATVLTAQASGCTPYQHAVTQIPYAIIAALISVVGYLSLGYF